MDVSNTAWTISGTAAPTRQIIQNTGDTIIAFTFAASLPAADAIALTGGACFTLPQGSLPVTLENLDSNNVYVRSLGPKAGKLTLQNTAS